MQLKKIISIFLAAALIFSVAPFQVAADGNEIFEVGVVAETATPISSSPVIISQGEEISFKISADQNTGITDLWMHIQYDVNIFEYVDCQSTNLFPGSLDFNQRSDGAVCLLTSRTVFTGTGVMFVLTLKAKADYCGNANVTVGLYKNSPNNCMLYNGPGDHHRVPFVGASCDVLVHAGLDKTAGVVTEPDCVNEGYTTFTCTACQETLIGCTVDALGHTAGEPIEENRVEPSFEVPGSYELVCYCTVCGEEASREVMVIPALKHNEGTPVMENYNQPSCTAEGSYDMVVRCTECNEELSRTTFTVPMIDHIAGPEVEENRINPTCISEGSFDTVVRCYVCSFELSRVKNTIDANGHTPADVVYENISNATCTAEGSQDAVVYCSVCDKEISRNEVSIPMLSHEIIPHDAQAPTCTEIGWDAYETCANCDYTTYVELPALGHDIVNHEAQAATCTEIGWEAYETCSCCDYTTYVEIPALGHDIVNHEAQAATCTEIGWDAYETCSRCDYSTYVELPALGHDIVNHEAQAATCTEIGWDAYETCSRCDYSTYSEISAAGHSFGDVVVVEPEYGKEGYSSHTCSVCGEEEKFDFVPALQYAKGDMDCDGDVDSDDAIYLLFHALTPSFYPIYQGGDMDGDGDVDSDDAIHLLYHALMPDVYPLA